MPEGKENNLTNKHQEILDLNNDEMIIITTYTTKLNTELNTGLIFEDKFTITRINDGSEIKINLVKSEMKLNLY